MKDVLEALIKAYEIQGCLAMENDFNEAGIDHVILTKVGTAAVVTRMLGGNPEEVLNAIRLDSRARQSMNSWPFW